MFLSLDILLGAALASLVVYNVVRWGLKLDGKIDDRQVAYSELAAMLRAAHLPKMAKIGHLLAALAIKKAATEIKSLVNSLDGPEELLMAMKENFTWQTGERIKRPQDRAELLETIANHPAARKELKALFAEQEAELVKPEPLTPALTVGPSATVATPV